jgi:hypothetical protein
MLAVVASGVATVAFGQGTPQMRSPATSTLEFIGGEIALGAVVRGAPFSGEGITTVSQTLGDGTRIERRTTAKVYRDSEGRIRREQTVLGLDVLKPSADAQPIVTLTDPVAGTTYVLDPNTRTARRNRAIVWRASESGATGLNTLRATAGIRVERLDDIPRRPLTPPPPGEPRQASRRGARGRGALPNCDRSGRVRSRRNCQRHASTEPFRPEPLQRSATRYGRAMGGAGSESAGLLAASDPRTGDVDTG